MRVLLAKSGPHSPKIQAGAEFSTHGLCQKLSARGHSPCVAATTDAAGVFQRTEEFGYPIFRAQTLAPALKAAVLEFHPDVIVLEDLSGDLDLSLAESLKNAGIVFYQHAARPIPIPPDDLADRALVLTSSPATAWSLLAQHQVSSVVMPPVSEADTVPDRFDECLRIAAGQHDAARVKLLRRPQAASRRQAIALSDLSTALRLAGSALWARLLPQGSWPRICGTAAKFSAAMRRDSNRRAVDAIMQVLGVPREPHAAHISNNLRAARYELAVQCLSGIKRPRFVPKIRLEGLQHLDGALLNGRGVVLWVAHFVFAANVVKMGLHQNGYSLSHVSRPEHGFSKTRAGIRFLNPLRSSFENRYLNGRIVVQRGNPSGATRAVLDILSNNGIVSTTAGDWEGAHLIESEFLYRTIRLSAGPIWFADQTGAALLPVIGVRTAEPDQFAVRIGPRLEIRADLDQSERWRLTAAEFLSRLAPAVLKYPGQWRGWSSLTAKT